MRPGSPDTESSLFEIDFHRRIIDEFEPILVFDLPEMRVKLCRICDLSGTSPLFQQFAKPECETSP
jgi:hypothetical protein